MTIPAQKSEATLTAAVKLVKAALDKVIENPEIKAYSPAVEAIKEFREDTQNMTLQKLREKLKIK